MEKDDPLASPLKVDSATLPHDEVPEVSMVEAEEVTGVTFAPELWMQRRRWAMDVLKKEGVRSVLDIGCGAGALLETLVMPSSTIPEPPIRSAPSGKSNRLDGKSNRLETQLPSPADSEEDEDDSSSELHLDRICAVDSYASVIPSALSILSPSASSSSFPPLRPRWAPLHTELWLGGIEKYNARMEGYEAITCLEVIEHLDPNVLSRFGVVTMGTYRPRLLLVTTPNFDFNAKFPRADDHDHGHKGFVDPTGRTERVFRHSDHKLEMTSGEFREWATSAAADWGYEVELGGVGVSSKPSYYPADDPHVPNAPIYATQTAVFRLASEPTRSPRSVRSTPLPFMPSSKESVHPHKLAGKFTHPPHAPGTGKKESPEDLRRRVRDILGLDRLNIGQVSLDELWGFDEICGASAGSKRYLVACLGGYGDCPSIGQSSGEFEIKREKRARSLVVQWNSFVPRVAEKAEQWGGSAPGEETRKPNASTGGW